MSYSVTAHPSTPPPPGTKTRAGASGVNGQTCTECRDRKGDIQVYSPYCRHAPSEVNVSVSPAPQKTWVEKATPVQSPDS